MKAKHSPEPWMCEWPLGNIRAVRDNGGDGPIFSAEHGEAVYADTCRANAHRAVECVNACAGLSDPLQLRRDNDALRVALAALYAESPNKTAAGENARRILEGGE